ncbi:hypothetical protein AG1IA_08136 [Rhizoctonia solani AG-1 IA]|uniref:Uncharacterized protein n=1 Tax=Thanatephorus cucumeris (strain AG1-IA) TaxID=983506 RepID=L8WI19_THACA|nr:hypothetical protein AG1IA_08136 [Rhizoctonia solani AG-1 IA]
MTSLRLAYLRKWGEQRQTCKLVPPLRPWLLRSAKTSTALHWPMSPSHRLSITTQNTIQTPLPQTQATSLTGMLPMPTTSLFTTLKRQSAAGDFGSPF